MKHLVKFLVVHFISLLFIIFPSISMGQTNFVSKVWVADNGDGTYKNPILHADYSDPDAIRVGDDFYLIASSFNSAPGLPILHSKDLVNWRLINYVFQKQKPFDVFDKPQHGNGSLGAFDTLSRRRILHILSRPGFRHLRDRKPKIRLARGLNRF